MVSEREERKERIEQRLQDTEALERTQRRAAFVKRIGRGAGRIAVKGAKMAYRYARGRPVRRARRPMPRGYYPPSAYYGYGPPIRRRRRRPTQQRQRAMGGGGFAGGSGFAGW